VNPKSAKIPLPVANIILIKWNTYPLAVATFPKYVGWLKPHWNQAHAAILFTPDN
jgi:hypothetical protein